MHTGRPSRRRRAVQLSGGVVFIASIAWFAWTYATTFGVPAASGGSATRPAMINTLWFTLFAAHHSIFAREGVKKALARVIPMVYERTVYVWIASILFTLMTLNWQAVPGVLWQVDRPFAFLLHAVQAFGFYFGFKAGRRFDVKELAGVRYNEADRVHPPPVLSDRGPYGLVRHPLNLSLMLIVWPVATMTWTRLVFAVCATVYFLIAIPLEERDLRRGWGKEYDDYSRRVRWRMIPLVY